MMTTSLRWLLSVLCVVFTAGCATVRPVRITAGGEALSRIVFPQESTEVLRPIAAELLEEIRKATGADLPLSGVSPLPSGPVIVLGTSRDFPKEAAAFGLDRLGPEGIAVCSTDNRLWLLGNSPVAVRHAVNAFLETVGFRWFFPDPAWTVVPKCPDLTVGIRLVAQPAFAFRRIWYGWGPRTPELRKDYDAWMKHNRQGGGFRVDCSHAWARYVPPRLFAQHPDWFALVKGKRKPPQLCVSNPEMQRHFINGVLAALRKHSDRNMISVEANDGAGYCECRDCRAVGTISDQVFTLANSAARAVRRDFPGKWVGLYAYADHAEPPHFRLEPNVYVQVTTGFRYTKLSFDKQVQAFRDLGARLGVYDYFSVYPWDFDLPGAAKAGRVHLLAEAIRKYRDLGLSTYTAESSCNWGPNGPGYWIAAHLMWDPDLDSHVLLHDFCRHAFGDAAAPMQRLYERWGRGERFSPRTLKLALLDLRAAFRAESAPDVRARLDRVAMYLHWLRLWLDYDQSSRHNEWNRLVVAPPEEIVENAHRCVVFARRIMDTGMIHVWPMLDTSWFATRFGALKRVDKFDFVKTTKAWKKERTDIPTHTEMATVFNDDLQRFASLPVVEIAGLKWTGPLEPIADCAPDRVAAWGDVQRSPLCVETGEFLFPGKIGEALRVTWRPFDKGHIVDNQWSLSRAGKQAAAGHVKAPKGKPASTDVRLPAAGLYSLAPGTGYWRAAEVDVGERPLVVRAQRANTPGRSKKTPLRLWLPRFGQPLYFFVPKGVRHFVIGIVSGGNPWTCLRLKTAAGSTVLDEKVLAGSEISVVVDADRREYGEISAMANNCVLPAAERSVTVPPGRDNQIWSLELSSLRCTVELFDVPPFLARHPAELLVPEDVFGNGGTAKSHVPSK